MLSHECVRRVAIGSITAFLLTLSSMSFGNSCGVLKSAAEHYTNRTDPATRDDIQKGKEIRWIMGYLHHAKSMYYELVPLIEEINFDLPDLPEPKSLSVMKMNDSVETFFNSQPNIYTHPNNGWDRDAFFCLNDALIATYGLRKKGNQ